MLAAMIQRAENRLGDHLVQLVRGMATFGSAELAGRIMRLATTIVIARQLTPDIVGEAAFALTVFELVRVLERIGTGQQIVIAPEADLPAMCNTVQRVYVAWTGILILLQWSVALALMLAGKLIAAQMVAALSLVFLFMAQGHVQYFLAMREGRLAALARIAAAQTIADQVLTLVMMLAWPSPWSIVLPKILVAPIWLLMATRAHPYRADAQAGYMPLRRVLGSSLSLLAADGLTALRTQGDNLIVGAVLGTRALGEYFFAFNAGLGIMTSLVGAFGAVAFPMLARVPDGPPRQMALAKVCALGLGVLVPLVLLQALTAPFYVPIVFGTHWAPTASIVSVMCLGGLALVMNQIVSVWHRANGNMRRDAMNSLHNCMASLAGLVAGAFSGSVAVAAAGLVCAGVLMAIWNMVQLPRAARYWRSPENAL